MRNLRSRGCQCGEQPLLLRSEFEKSRQRNGASAPCEDFGRAAGKPIGELRIVESIAVQEHSRVMFRPPGKDRAVIAATGPSAPARPACTPRVDECPRIRGKSRRAGLVLQWQSFVGDDTRPQIRCLDRRNTSRRIGAAIASQDVEPESFQPGAPRHDDRGWPDGAPGFALRLVVKRREATRQSVIRRDDGGAGRKRRAQRRRQPIPAADDSHHTLRHSDSKLGDDLFTSTVRGSAANARSVERSAHES